MEPPSGPGRSTIRRSSPDSTRPGSTRSSRMIPAFSGAWLHCRVRRGLAFTLLVACAAAGVLSAVVLAASPSATAQRGRRRVRRRRRRRRHDHHDDHDDHDHHDDAHDPAAVHDRGRRHRRRRGPGRGSVTRRGHRRGEGLLRSTAGAPPRQGDADRDAEAARRVRLRRRRSQARSRLRARRQRAAESDRAAAASGALRETPRQAVRSGRHQLRAAAAQLEAVRDEGAAGPAPYVSRSPSRASSAA